MAQLCQAEDLRVDFQAMSRVDAPDTALLLLTGATALGLFTLRRVYPLACYVVEEVLPVAGDNALLELAALFGKVGIFVAQSKLHQLVLVMQGETGREVDQAMRVAGDEVHWSVLQTQRIKEFLDWLPPLARRSHIANV